LIRQSWRPGDDPFGGWRAACRSEMDFAVVAPGQELDFFAGLAMVRINALRNRESDMSDRFRSGEVRSGLTV